jgi:HAD superfamily hydrolase (TIGR01509 family)
MEGSRTVAASGLAYLDGISALLFDNDGVLAHTEQAWFDANVAVLQTMGVPYSKADFVRHTFEEPWGSSGWLERAGHDAEFIDGFAQRRNQLWRATIAATDVVEPTATAVLATLGQHFRLGVITNTAREQFDLIHSGGSLSDLLEVLVVRGDYERPKPAPDAYLAGLAKLGLPAWAVLAVEDSPRGIRAAQAAGIRAVAIGNPAFPDLDVSHADFRIDRMEDLLALTQPSAAPAAGTSPPPPR